MALIPNGNLQDLASPFDIRLNSPSISFTAGTGQGFVTAILNAIRRYEREDDQRVAGSSRPTSPRR
jgi:hypothetical protein